MPTTANLSIAEKLASLIRANTPAVSIEKEVQPLAPCCTDQPGRAIHEGLYSYANRHMRILNFNSVRWTPHMNQRHGRSPKWLPSIGNAE